MKIDFTLCYACVDLEGEISEEEFELNWNSQVPHWYFVTEEGINFMKGTKGKKYKRKCDEIL